MIEHTINWWAKFKITTKSKFCMQQSAIQNWQRRQFSINSELVVEASKIHLSFDVHEERHHQREIEAQFEQVIPPDFGRHMLY